MKKTILTFVMMLMVALTTQTTMAVPVSKADSIVDAQMQGVERVKEKIDKTLNDTIASSEGGVISLGEDTDMTAEDIKEISNQWASVVKQLFISGTFCLLGLIALVLFFRFLNRRSKYRVIEKAIMNNYPLNDISLSDSKHSAIYVQQPVMPAAPQPGQVPVGTPLPGATPGRPIVMNAMPNWRALMPAVKWMGWGVAIFLFGCCLGDFDNPFWPIGLALIFVGLCKGYILHKEQKVLQEAWERNAAYVQPEPMREGIPVPPPMSQYNDDVSAND